MTPRCRFGPRIAECRWSAKRRGVAFHETLHTSVNAASRKALAASAGGGKEYCHYETLAVRAGLALCSVWWPFRAFADVPESGWRIYRHHGRDGDCEWCAGQFAESVRCGVADSKPKRWRFHGRIRGNAQCGHVCALSAEDVVLRQILQHRATRSTAERLRCRRASGRHTAGLYPDQSDAIARRLEPIRKCKSSFAPRMESVSVRHAVSLPIH